VEYEQVLGTCTEFRDNSWRASLLPGGWVVDFRIRSSITTQKECKIDAFPQRVTREVKKRARNFGVLGSSHWVKLERTATA